MSKGVSETGKLESASVRGQSLATGGADSRLTTAEVAAFVAADPATGEASSGTRLWSQTWLSAARDGTPSKTRAE
ncbi:hypothetical protein [Natrinema longum]|uniref:Uncharacterized protein n=1 Tax=Natrinema longum TaxID=370324 RepID=A0A8A2UAP3_9EURY|nr:hypothetical protein [Natrinema longum]MBZ6496577.1 hypothetical protein [Natrinema longum]QSW85522.1 hypothetical protein J0X27_01360 [Natrinema longum]